MTNLIEAFIKEIISAVFTSALAQSRTTVVIIHALIYAFVGYLFIIRPQRSILRKVDPKAKSGLLMFWFFMLILAALGVWFDFEIWPALILLAVFNRAFGGKKLGIGSHIPGLRDVPEFSNVLKKIYVGFYGEFQIYTGKPRKGHFWEDIRAGARFQTARNNAIFFIVLATAIPGLWVSLGNAILIEPIGTLVQGGLLGDVPRDIITSLGTSMFILLFLVGYSLIGTTIIFGESFVKNNAPNEQEISRAKDNVDMYFRQLTGGYSKLVLKMLIFLVVGGFGTALHFVTLMR